MKKIFISPQDTLKVIQSKIFTAQNYAARCLHLFIIEIFFAQFHHFSFTS